MGATSESKTKSKSTEKAVIAGGCFWCMQPPYDMLKGVVRTTVGYIGGASKNPTYEEVCGGRSGHAEAIEVEFDPSVVSYEQVIDLFWRNIDPTALNRQFCDLGDQYRTAIFYYGEAQKKIAEESREKWERTGKFGRKIVTQIVPGTTFYPAEDYHQKFYMKNPERYYSYKNACGREQYLDHVWGEDRIKS